MSNLVIHTRCLSVRDPWGTYLSMHLSRRTTRPSISSNLRGARYVPRNIISIAARDTTLENSTPSSYHNNVSDTMQMTCSNEKWGDNHFDNKAQFTTRNTTPTNKQQVSKSFSTSHKEIHEFRTLNKSLEIHLPQIVEQSLWDLSLSFLFCFQLKAIYSH